jgi:hypothetical protein
VDHHALSFVDYRYPGIFVDYIQGKILRDKIYTYRILPKKVQFLPSLQGPGDLHLFPIYSDLKFSCLDLGTGKDLQGFRNVPIHPEPRKNGFIYSTRETGQKGFLGKGLHS